MKNSLFSTPTLLIGFVVFSTFSAQASRSCNDVINRTQDHARRLELMLTEALEQGPRMMEVQLSNGTALNLPENRIAEIRESAAMLVVELVKLARNQEDPDALRRAVVEGVLAHNAEVDPVTRAFIDNNSLLTTNSHIAGRSPSPVAEKSTAIRVDEKTTLNDLLQRFSAHGADVVQDPGPVEIAVQRTKLSIAKVVRGIPGAGLFGGLLKNLEEAKQPPTLAAKIKSIDSAFQAGIFETHQGGQVLLQKSDEARVLQRNLAIEAYTQKVIAETMQLAITRLGNVDPAAAERLKGMPLLHVVSTMEMKLNLFLVLDSIIEVYGTSYSSTQVQLMRAYLARTQVVATLAASMTGQSQLENIRRSSDLTAFSERVTQQQLKTLGSNVAETTDQVKALLEQSGANAKEIVQLRDEAIRLDQELQRNIIAAAQQKSEQVAALEQLLLSSARAAQPLLTANSPSAKWAAGKVAVIGQTKRK